jgi:ABC-type antimicrobial peptide transport system permease subunit
MRTLRLFTVAAVCALGTVICFVLGGVVMGSSGVGDLIPEAGRPGRDWIAALDRAGGLFFVGPWLVVLVGFLGIVALEKSACWRRGFSEPDW